MQRLRSEDNLPELDEAHPAYAQELQPDELWPVPESAHIFGPVAQDKAKTEARLGFRVTLIKEMGKA